MRKSPIETVTSPAQIQQNCDWSGKICLFPKPIWQTCYINLDLLFGFLKLVISNSWSGIQKSTWAKLVVSEKGNPFYLLGNIMIIPMEIFICGVQSIFTQSHVYMSLYIIYYIIIYIYIVFFSCPNHKVWFQGLSYVVFVHIWLTSRIRSPMVKWGNIMIKPYL